MEIYRLKDEIVDGKRRKKAAGGERERVALRGGFKKVLDGRRGEGVSDSGFRGGVPDDVCQKGEANGGEAHEVLEITEMRQGVKNPNRVNVFIDGVFGFSLDVAQVVDYKLKVGKELSELEFSELKKASEFGKLYQRTLEWVLIRPRSVKETKDYLHKKLRNVLRGPSATNGERQERLNPVTTGAKERFREEYSEFFEAIVERLTSKGYIADEKFAEWYVENRFVKKGISKKRLEMELRKKGIAQGIIEDVLSKRNDEEEIKKMAMKKRARYDDEKLISYLCRQGFSYDLVRHVVLEEKEEQEQEQV